MSILKEAYKDMVKKWLEQEQKNYTIEEIEKISEEVSESMLSSDHLNSALNTEISMTLDYKGY